MIGNKRKNIISSVEHGTHCTLLTAEYYCCDIIMIH